MFSIICPMDTNRLKQFEVTKRVYDSFPQEKEFIIPTRSYAKVANYLDKHDLIKDVRLISYQTEVGFNPSKAFNLGVRAAKYDNIIITSPEVKPLTDVLAQFAELQGQNVIAMCYDEKSPGGDQAVLVDTSFRSDTPAMYFLAMFNKADIEKINGWDEEFMKGYAYEDNDFGDRWVRAGLPFSVHDEIRALHQWHERKETLGGGLAINNQHRMDNTDSGITYVEHGLNGKL